MKKASWVLHDGLDKFLYLFLISCCLLYNKHRELLLFRIIILDLQSTTLLLLTLFLAADSWCKLKI